MATLEHPVVGPTQGHANTKALASLIIGIFAMANVVATVLIFCFFLDQFEETASWLLPPFVALCSGLIAAFLGSIGWIDVRRGVTDRRLFEAQFGTILGGMAAALVVIAIAVLFLVYIVLFLSLASDLTATGGMD